MSEPVWARAMRKRLATVSLALTCAAFVSVIPSAPAASGGFPREHGDPNEVNVDTTVVDAGIDLPSPEVWSVAEDSQGFIWFATGGGLARLDQPGGTTTYRTRVLGQNSRGTESVRSVVADPVVGVWIAASTLKHVDPWTREVTEYPIAADRLVGVGNRLWAWSPDGVTLFDMSRRAEVATMIISDQQARADTLQLAMSDAGVLYILQGGEISSVAADGTVRNVAIAGRATGLASSSEGGIWVSSPSGIWRIESDDGRSRRVTNLPAEFADGAARPTAELIELADHTILLGSETGRDGAIRIFDPHSGNWTPPSAADPGGGRLHAVFQDSKQTIWANREPLGIVKIRPLRSTFEQIPFDETLTPTGTNHGVLDISAHDDVMFVARGGAGLQRFNTTTQEWDAPIQFPERGSSPQTIDVVAVATTSEHLWIGTLDDGLFRAPLGGGDAVPVVSSSAFIGSLMVHNDVVYASVWGEGVEVFDTSGRVTSFIRPEWTPGVKNLFANALSIGNGQILIGGEHGLDVINRVTRDVKQFNRTDNDLRSDSVDSIFVESRSIVWVASSLGLERVNLVTGETALVGLDQFGSGLQIESLTPYGTDSNVLVTTRSALHVFDPSTASIVATLGAEQGFFTSQFAPTAGAIDGDGQVFLGTANGLLVVPPDLQASPKATTATTFVRCLDGCGPEFDGGIVETDGSVTFEFISTDYGNLSDVIGQYRLTGHDDDWRDVTGRARTIVYSDLPPGQYSIEVRPSPAATPDAAEQVDAVSRYQAITVSVIVPWWRNTTIQLFSTIALVATAGFAFILWSWRRARAERELETIIGVRTEELDAARVDAELANRAKGEVLSVVAHDIRSPLSGILGYAELLEGAIEESNRTRYVAGIKQASLHLVALVEDLNTSNSGTVSTEVDRRCPADVAKLVNQAVTFVEPTAWAKDMVVNAVIDDALASQHLLDIKPFHQVLVNLLSNGVAHSAGTTITLAVNVLWQNEIGTQRVEFSVSDDGGSLDPAEIDLIFARNQRGANAASEGFGLGLAISRELVDSLGGNLRVTVDPSIRTTFQFTLSLLIGETSTSDTNSPTVPDQRTPLVFIVDDDSGMRALMTETFRRSGWATRSFSTANQLLAQLGTERPHLVCTDLAMPPKGGIELASEIHALHIRGMRIVAVTGCPEEAVASALFHDVISKPWMRSELDRVMMESDPARRPPANAL